MNFVYLFSQMKYDLFALEILPIFFLGWWGSEPKRTFFKMASEHISYELLIERNHLQIWIGGSLGIFLDLLNLIS